MRYSAYRRIFYFFVVAFPLAGIGRAAETWQKLQTKDVVIYSDASRRDIIEFAVGYAAFRHVFAETFTPQQPPPATVLLFRRLGKLQDYLPAPSRSGENEVSFSANVDGDELLALAVDGDRRAALRQTYEFDTIWELGRVGYALPIWMSQGAGEVLSSLEVEKNKCTIGDGPQTFVESWSQLAPIEWPRFFDISNGSPEYSGPTADGAYHAQSWALMHWVLLDDAHTAERFNQLADKLHDTGGLAAVESTLHVSAKELMRAVERHLRRADTIRTFPFDADALRKQLNPVPAAEAEVAVQKANLLFATSKSANARQELARAQSLSPDAPAVKEALARQALQDRDSDAAIRYYREAIAAGSISPRAHLLSAKQWLDDNTTGGVDHEGDGGPNVDHALSDVRKALQLDPGSSFGYQLLGRAFFVASKATEDELGELSRGVVSGDDGAVVRYYRALLYRRLGHRSDYETDLRKIIGDSAASDQMRTTARNELRRNTLKETSDSVEELVKAKHYDEAAALVARRTSEPDNSPAADDYAKLASWIAERRMIEDVRTAYERHDWAKAKAAAQSYLDKFPDGPAAASIQQMLKTIQRASASNRPKPAAPSS